MHSFFGPIYGAALGAGIGGLIQGESLEQAFGSALTAGAGGGLRLLGGAGRCKWRGKGIRGRCYKICTEIVNFEHYWMTDVTGQKDFIRMASKRDF